MKRNSVIYMIPLAKPYIDEREISAVVEVLKSGWLTHGPKVKEFERMFAEYIGTKYAIAVNSCTSALQLVMEVLNIKGEVILPSFTFVASANAIVTSGAIPIFVDIVEDTYNIDPNKIEERINKRTQAIMPVHFAGHPCDMKPIMEIAEKHNLHVIEDSAECIGGLYNNKKTGSFGIGCFSFFPTKNITTGEGGIITTNDDSLEERIKILRAHGIPSMTHEREKSKKPWLRSATEAGYNFRMCDINAAIGIEQMKKIDDMNKKRIEVARYLSKKLTNNKITKPTIHKNCRHVFQIYVIMLDTSINRIDFIKKVMEKDIQASVHFDPPVHLQPYYTNIGWKKGDLPITEHVSEHVVTLPLFPSITKRDLDFISQIINSILA